MSVQCSSVVRMVRIHEDLDYVKTAQALNSLAVKMRRSSITAALLLEKAGLELDLGNCRQAYRTAQQALCMEPELLAAHVLAAKASFFLGLTAAGMAEASPGTPGQDPGKAWQELGKARDILQRLGSLPGEGKVLLGFLGDLLQGEPSEAKLVARLRSHFGL